MFKTVFRLVRAQWMNFVGMFIALSLGVALMTSMGMILMAALLPPSQPPGRFAEAPVVVVAATPDWATSLRDTDTPRFGLAPEVAASVKTTGRTVVDRTFYAQITNGPANQVGHGWSVAAMTPYKLVAGHAPRQDSEVVVGEGAARVGQQVKVLTAFDTRLYMVSGVVKLMPFESALFFTDSEAARISPRIDAVAVFASPAAVEHAVGDRAQILTGADRRTLDPDTKQNQQALNSTAIVAAMATGLAAFVSIFVVASTFAFAVTQRLRELALFRLVGATARQIAGMLFAEALVVSVVASAAGVALGWLGAPLVASWLTRLNLAPEWFVHSSSWLPACIAFGVGLSVALLGAGASARRATRIRAVDALREATIETKTVGKGRILVGLAVLAAAFIALAWVAFKEPHLATIPFIFIWVLILPIVAFALFAPLVVAPVARLVTLPFNPAKNAVATLVRANTLAAARRTAATAAPVLLTVGLCLMMLSAVATISHAGIVESSTALRADYVVTPSDTPGLNAVAIDRLRTTGATVAAQTNTVFYTIDNHNSLRRYTAAAIEPTAFAKTQNTTLVSGAFADLHDDSIIVSDDMGPSVGQTVDLWLADGTKVALHVAGVFAPRIAGPDAYITSGHAAGSLADLAYIQLEAGVSAKSVQAAARDIGAQLASKSDWTARTESSTSQAAMLGLLVVLATTALYSAIAIVNTMVMAAAGRLRDFAVLRLSGATMSQVLIVAAAEAILAALIGIILAVCAFAISSVGLQLALGQLVDGFLITIPWLPVVMVTIASIVLAVCASTLPVYTGLRKILARDRCSE